MQSKKSKELTRRQFMRDGAIAAAGLAAGLNVLKAQGAGDMAAVRKTRSYNPEMEYRRLGKTGLWVSAACLGGHWKRIDKIITDAPGAFEQNRRDVVNRCMEQGINYIDFAGDAEPEAYCKALGSRREEMYLAYSHPASEIRNPANRNAKKLLELFEVGLKRCKLEYADIWRIMALERGGRHSQPEAEEMVKALDIARKQGKCRFTGLSTHDRKWAKMLIETYPDVIQVLVFPYTAASKAVPQHSLFDAIKKYDVGTLGIKPFASNSLFKGDGSPDSSFAEQDDRRARMAIRYILCNPAITAPIPGLVSIHQVDNVVKAVKERRELDVAEKAELQKATDEMWARLPQEYQWLKEWKYV